MQPPGADEVAYAFGMAVLVVLTVLSELVALGFGVAGALQLRRKKTFAVFGRGSVKNATAPEVRSPSPI